MDLIARQAILVAVLSVASAACAANGAPSRALIAIPVDVVGAATVRPTTTDTTRPSATISRPTLSPSPNPKLAPTAEPAPMAPKPAGVKFDTQAVAGDERERYADITQTVSWRTPRSEDIEIRVYGVTKCSAEPKDPLPDTSGPCLVTGTPLPASVRTLLGKAPASDGRVSWSWLEETGCDIGLPNDPDGPVYYAVVLAAYNASGHSIFAIAEPGLWWQSGPNDVVC
jgi:hypothetical protein